jgi:hypothetical protein
MGRCLLLPFLLSSAAWIYLLFSIRNATGKYAETIFFTGAAIGAIPFCLTGPVTGLALSICFPNGKLKVWSFCAVFVLVAVPILSFEILASASSILPAFIGGGPWTFANAQWEMFYEIVAAVCWYGLFMLLLDLLLPDERSSILVPTRLTSVPRENEISKT